MKISNVPGIVKYFISNSNKIFLFLYFTYRIRKWVTAPTNAILSSGCWTQWRMSIPIRNAVSKGRRDGEHLIARVAASGTSAHDSVAPCTLSVCALYPLSSETKECMNFLMVQLLSLCSSCVKGWGGGRCKREQREGLYP